MQIWGEAGQTAQPTFLEKKFLIGVSRIFLRFHFVLPYSMLETVIEIELGSIPSFLKNHFVVYRFVVISYLVIKRLGLKTFSRPDLLKEMLVLEWKRRSLKDEDVCYSFVLFSMLVLASV